MVFPEVPRRLRLPRFGPLPRPAPVWGTDSGKLYGLLLMLVLMLFFMATFSGQAPHAVAKVFDPQQPQAAAPELSEAGRAARHAMIEQRYAGALYDPKDGAGFAQTQGYRLLIQALIEDQVRTGEVGIVPVPFDYALAVKDPDALRGKRVHVSGVFAGLYQQKYAEPLEPPVFKVEHVWRGAITNGDGDDGVMFDVLDRPDGIEPRDEVELEGIFYRLVSYETKLGKRREAPYILARTLKKSTAATAGSPGFVQRNSSIFIVALALLALFGIWRVATAHRRLTRRPASPSPSNSIAARLAEHRRRGPSHKPLS